MSLQIDKIRDKADRVLGILAEAGRWLLMAGFIVGIGFILVRTVSSAP
jgi:hypothetical protein